MKTSYLISWLSLPTIIIACGPDGPSEFTENTGGGASTAAGGGTIVATSDAALADTSTGVATPPTGTSGAEPFGGASSDGSAVVPDASTSTVSDATVSTSTGAAGSSGGVTSTATGGDGEGGAPSVAGAGVGGTTGATNSSAGGAGGGEVVGAAGGAAGQTSATTGEETLAVPMGSLMLTEYLESGSDKAVEISNVSDASVNLASCELNIYFNGATEPGRRIALEAELVASASHLVCKSTAADLLAVCQQQAGGMTFNGDDVVTLVCDAAIHDSIGQIGVAVDGSWLSGETSTADQILRRSCDAVPRTDPSISFDPALEWLSVGEVLGETRDLSGLGEPSCAAAP